MTKVEFGIWLKEKRMSLKISQVKLANEIGVDKGYLSQVEAGLRPASDDLLEKMSKYFEISEDAIKNMAGKIPEDILKILREHPVDAPQLLRKKFEGDE